MRKVLKNIKFVTVLIIVIIGNHVLFSQEIGYKYYNKFYICPPKPDSLYNIGEYRKSITYNLTRTDSTGNLIRKVNYLLAQNYSLLKMEDSAFHYLNQYIFGPYDYRPIYIDEDFDFLRKNKEKWNAIITRIEDIYLLELESYMNKNLALKLFRIGAKDHQIEFCVAHSRTDATTFQANPKQSLRTQKEVKKIIKKYGLPTPSMVGQTACNVVVENIILSQKHYDMVKKAYEKGDFNPTHYASITDKWMVRNNKKQIYGTIFTKKVGEECYKLSEVEDFEHLNQRRAEMGLPAIEEYSQKLNGIIPEEYYNSTNK